MQSERTLNGAATKGNRLLRELTLQWKLSASTAARDVVMTSVVTCGLQVDQTMTRRNFKWFYFWGVGQLMRAKMVYRVVRSYVWVVYDLISFNSRISRLITTDPIVFVYFVIKIKFLFVFSKKVFRMMFYGYRMKKFKKKISTRHYTNSNEWNWRNTRENLKKKID